ncbi:DUF4124 domain-containing protein [Ottowia flava]|uniref:DUF4124 domain-containing protein n=1 Tax=Ottowia flava TaxID=2675430 RepID=A0ABW4KSY4_9BURK|nr:DUF4124 domain-containing protein [Ottowia sp. GY511]
MTRTASTLFSSRHALLGAQFGALLLFAAPWGALAQPTPAASAPQAGASAPKAPAGPTAPTIKRWVDERGVVHFSDAPPPANGRPASRVTDIATVPPLAASEQSRARDLMQQYRNYLDQEPQASASAASAARRATGPSASNQSCAAQWQRYGAAYRCLDGFRAAKGVVRPEAFERCPVVKEPDCPAPSSP